MKIEEDVRDALDDVLSKIVEIFENRVDKTNLVENTSNDDINQISCNKILFLILHLSQKSFFQNFLIVIYLKDCKIEYDSLFWSYLSFFYILL
jgi:hypothetical protein